MDHLTDKQAEIVDKLRARYAGVHPVVFQRMLERAATEVELFDILDTFSADYPIAFDADARRLVPAKDILNRG